MGLAAHRPGAIPLRPLGLGDMFDGAFRIIRFNPRATVGSAVLVGAVCMAIPIIATTVLTLAIDISFDLNAEQTSSTGPSNSDLVALIGSYGSLVLGIVLQYFGLVLVTGMVTQVVAAAAIGRRLTMGEAWAATRGKRWRLIGLMLVLGLLTTLLIGAYVLTWVALAVLDLSTVTYVVYGFVSVPLFIVAMCWFWVRIYLLPVPALMLEPVGVFGALGRAFRLSSRQFWRIFGIALLTSILAAIAGNILSVPVSMVGQVGMLALPVQYMMLALVVSSALAQVLATAFTAPFTSSVTALQYLDQRMRKEGYDVDLMTRAGITAG